jgi:hypothetical protein
MVVSHGLLRGDGARLECHHDSIDLFGERRRRNADLDRAHTAAHKHVGEVGGAGEIVGDCAEQQVAHVSSVRLRVQHQ